MPVLTISEIEFDDNGNRIIDAYETCKIKFKVLNAGNGTANGCIAKAKIDNVDGINIKNVSLPTLDPGGSCYVTMDVVASDRIINGKANISIYVDEPNGFGCDPTVLSIDTKAFVAPKLLVSDYSVKSQQGGALTKRLPFDLQILLQNASHGVADDVEVYISIPQNVFLVEGEKQTTFKKLDAEETKTLNYSLVVNNNYSENTIPVQFVLREKHGKYAENRTIHLALHQSNSQKQIEIKGETTIPQGEIQIAKIDGASKQADVDVAIPENKPENKNTFAVVFANENYLSETAVNFALNDGNVLSQYFAKTLGLPTKNIRLVNNATLNMMRNQIDWLKEVSKAYNGDLNIILYYAGHGMPDEENSKAYLIPNDGNSANPATCISLNSLYEELSAMNAKQVCVFLDACFSGAQRGDGMLMAARGVSIKPKTEYLNGNLVVFSAAQGTETAYPYSEMGHGLFTYYLLKKLQESKGDVTLEELSEYITTNVSRSSIVENGKPQTPSTSVSTTLGDKWKKWTLK